MIPRRDNYALQAEAARLRFLTYDQAAMPVRRDDEFLYLPFCGAEYRVCRADGHIFRHDGENWLPADSHGEVLTIFDYLCDAKPGRAPAGEAVSMAFLGGHAERGKCCTDFLHLEGIQFPEQKRALDKPRRCGYAACF